MVEAGRNLEFEWLTDLFGGVMVGVALGRVGFWCQFAARGGGDPMKCGSCRVIGSWSRPCSWLDEG